MIVTVKAPICKVIRMSLTPFRVVWPTACRSCNAMGIITYDVARCNKKRESVAV